MMFTTLVYCLQIINGSTRLKCVSIAVTRCNEGEPRGRSLVGLGNMVSLSAFFVCFGRFKHALDAWRVSVLSPRTIPSALTGETNFG